MLDLKIVGGTIVDGSGSPRYRGDVGIKKGMITALGDMDEPARETIDASGKIVSPGFVDVHTHYDAQVFWDPTLSPSCYHGVTTVVGGHCGFSIAPLAKHSAAYLGPMLARVEGIPLPSLLEGLPWDWTSFAEYLGAFEDKLAINAGFLAGHCAIRHYVMGERSLSEKATPEELEQMKELLRESIRGGALGFSTTISVTHNDAAGHPVPSRHASREEILELYGVISEFEGTLAEIAPGLRFTEEDYRMVTDISLAAKRPLNWNAIAIMNGREDEAKDNVRKLGASTFAEERGGKVIALHFPYSATVRLNLVGGFTFDAIPDWAPFFQLPLNERMEKLRDPTYIAKLKAGAAAATDLFAFFADVANMYVAEAFSQENKRYEGRKVGEIAEEEGRDPFDVFFAIALADELRTSFAPEFPEETPEIYKRRAEMYDDPRTIIGASDAGAHLDMLDGFSLPTALLERAVRKHGVITLEAAVHQLTQKPAELIGLRDRGMLKEGWHADVLVFDENKIAPDKLHTREDLPANGARLYREATGIEHVIVNGREIIRGGKHLGVPAGIVIRPGKDTYTVPIPGQGNAPRRDIKRSA